VFRDFLLIGLGLLGCCFLQSGSTLVVSIRLRLLVETLPLVGGTVLAAIVVKDLHSLLAIISKLLQVECLLHDLVVTALEIGFGPII
jgi:hypothetical protein